MAELRLRVNGEERRVTAHPLARLLDVLREELHLTGTKEGCGEGECGACAVWIDGELVNSCLVPVLQADGAEVRTVEGLASGGLHPVQRAFLEYGGAQCGICTPGMIMAAVALGKRPTLETMRVGLAGNLCRCTGYTAIYRSITAATRVTDRKGINRGDRGDRRVKKSQQSASKNHARTKIPNKNT
jgi:aerobic-type carbon monoxide dehydrogenase small subunit (CoxS/CutS family)